MTKKKAPVVTAKDIIAGLLAQKKDTSRRAEVLATLCGAVSAMAKKEGRRPDQACDCFCESNPYSGVFDDFRFSDEILAMAVRRIKGEAP